MKKFYLSLVLGSIALLTACSKSDDLQPELISADGKTYTVNITTDVFSKTTTDLKYGALPHVSEESDALKKYVPKLYCRIYNSVTGELVFRDTQLPGSAISYGKINSNLPAGKYTAVFVGSGNYFSRVYGLNGGAEDVTLNYSHFDTRVSVALQDLPLQDIFYKKTTFTVVDQPVSQSVKLDRIVAGLDVIIEDAIPANVNYIEVGIPGDGATFHFSNNSIGGSVNRTCRFGSENGIINNKLSTFLLKPETKAISIKAYDSNNKVIASRIVECDFFVNKKTVLSGKLFNNSNDFVDVNPEWDNAAPVVNF